jgi:hypothetical protein
VTGVAGNHASVRKIEFNILRSNGRVVSICGMLDGQGDAEP